MEWGGAAPPVQAGHPTAELAGRAAKVAMRPCCHMVTTWMARREITAIRAIPGTRALIFLAAPGLTAPADRVAPTGRPVALALTRKVAAGAPEGPEARVRRPLESGGPEVPVEKAAKARAVPVASEGKGAIAVRTTEKLEARAARAARVLVVRVGGVELAAKAIVRQAAMADPVVSVEMVLGGKAEKVEMVERRMAALARAAIQARLWAVRGDRVARAVKAMQGRRMGSWVAAGHQAAGQTARTATPATPVAHAVAVGVERTVRRAIE